jgi:L-threonylcarbamoyladenylate synthase
MARLKLMSVEHGAEKLGLGKVIAYPTEAVYGLGCDPGNERAVQRILALKNRSPDAGLILIADSFDRLAGYVKPVPEQRMSAARASWPGPVTWLFPRADHVPDYLAGKHPTIALRVTSHPTCRALCSAFGGAIVSTSANPGSGRPAKSPEEVASYFGDSIDGIVAGALGEQKLPSEIRDLATGAVIRAA